MQGKMCKPLQSLPHHKYIKNVSLAVNTVDYLDLLTKDLKQLVAEQR